jgi:hypothetical protein
MTPNSYLNSSVIQDFGTGCLVPSQAQFPAYLARRSPVNVEPCRSIGQPWAFSFLWSRAAHDRIPHDFGVAFIRRPVDHRSNTWWRLCATPPLGRTIQLVGGYRSWAGVLCLRKRLLDLFSFVFLVAFLRCFLLYVVDSASGDGYRCLNRGCEAGWSKEGPWSSGSPSGSCAGITGKASRSSVPLVFFGGHSQ